MVPESTFPFFVVNTTDQYHISKGSSLLSLFKRVTAEAVQSLFEKPQALTHVALQSLYYNLSYSGSHQFVEQVHTTFYCFSRGKQNNCWYKLSSRFFFEKQFHLGDLELQTSTLLYPDGCWYSLQMHQFKDTGARDPQQNLGQTWAMSGPVVSVQQVSGMPSWMNPILLPPVISLPGWLQAQLPEEWLSLTNEAPDCFQRVIRA